MERMRSGFWKATSMMVAVQVMLSGMNILMKVAANDGMDNSVMMAYRFLFGALFLLPIAFFGEGKRRPKLTWKAFLYACLAGLFYGSLGFLTVESLVRTSATFVSAMTNLTPAVTFLVAVCLRLEKLGWNTAAGKAKMLGTLLGLSGAMLFIFYKGPDITIWKTNVDLLEITSHDHVSQKFARSDKDRILGAILGFLGCISYSLWLIIKARAAVVYPAPLSFTALLTLMSAIFSSIMAICAQRDPGQWKLGWNIRLLTVSYLGFFATAVINTFVSLSIRMRGPLFVAVFNPLTLIIVGVVGSLVMDENLHLGNLLGSIVIIGSLYLVLWGKGKEVINANKSLPLQRAIASEPDQNRKRDIVKKLECA